jgi:hypothetical protein
MLLFFLCNDFTLSFPSPDVSRVVDGPQCSEYLYCLLVSFSIYREYYTLVVEFCKHVVWATFPGGVCHE